MITINDADRLMDEKKAKWKQEHPDEKMPRCPKCDNTGLIRFYRDEEGNKVGRNDLGAYEFLKPCSCIEGEPQLLKNNRHFSAVPDLYADARLGNFDVTIYKDIEADQLAASAKDIATKYIENFEKLEQKGFGMYIWSTARGCGKTRLASTICNELTEKGVRNKFVTANQILSEIKETWNDNNKQESQVLRKYEEARLLVIDDLGTQYGKQWIDEPFLNIINARYNANKPTIVTSNYEVDRLPFGENRIIDRLGEGKRYVNVKMPRVSVRKMSRGNQAFYDALKEE